jgi:uncharacterized membrane protein YoaK (UPF0700 family)
MCLAALAGYVDALGFLFMRGQYISFMSGNSTWLAAELGRDLQAAASAASLIGGFVFGVIVAQLLAARHLAFDQAAVGVLAGTHLDCHSVDGCGNGTYVTGTLVKCGRRLAVALLGQDRLGWLPYLLLWCGSVSAL